MLVEIASVGTKNSKHIPYGCDRFQSRRNPTLFPKSVGYLKFDRVRFEIFVTAEISLNNSALIDGEICCCVVFTC